MLFLLNLFSSVGCKYDANMCSIVLHNIHVRQDLSCQLF